MKKKILNLLVILLLTTFLFILTGCGDAQVSVNPLNPGEIGQPQQPEQTVAQGEDREIASVKNPFTESNSESIVTLSRGMGTSYVVNESGKIQYELEGIDGEYSNGYVYSKNNNNVKDLKSNTVIATGDADTTCVGVTSGGYVLQNVVKEELAGKVYKSQIIDKTGKVIWSHENKSSKPEYFKAVYGDYVIYLTNTYSNQKYTIIDAKTGKTTSTGYCSVAGYFEYKIKGKYMLIGITANNDHYSIFNMETGELINTKLSHIHKILNDKYVYATPLWGTVGIYSTDGTLVKSLEEGKVQDIYYYNNKYYVISTTGFYYTLDDKFTYVDQPVKINSVYKEIRPTQYGIYFTTGESTSTNKNTKTKTINVNDKQYFIKESDFEADKDVTAKAKQIAGVIDFQDEVGKSSFAKNLSNNNIIIDLSTGDQIYLTR